MRFQKTVFLALLLGLAGAPTADAAKIPCNVLSDDKGDGEMDATGLSSPALDIISGDIATGKTELVAVLRVASTSVSSDPVGQVGVSWALAVTVKGEEWSFYASSGFGPGYKISSGVRIGSQEFDVPVVVTPTSFTWKIKRSQIKALSQPKQVLKKIRANTGAGGFGGDAALNENSSYVDRAPSCVKAK